MSKINEFYAEVVNNVNAASMDKELLEETHIWLTKALKHNYTHNFKWLGRPVIQVPQDTYVVQELVWDVKPDLIIETGIAHGGSLILSASMLALLDYCDAIEQGQTLDPKASNRLVVGIDIDIRSHNREAIEAHPMNHLIKMVEGSSISPEAIDQVHKIAGSYKKILVFFDSNHTHDHVLAELKAYAPLTSVGSYCVVWDSGVEDMPDDIFNDCPWGKGNNPKTAVFEYLRELGENVKSGKEGFTIKFEIDKFIESKIMITSARDGFLKRVR
jgi:cephalosporin hydroxylase